MLFVQMLSISVADTFVTRVGLLINAKKLYSYNVSTNSAVGLCIFEFKKNYIKITLKVACFLFFVNRIQNINKFLCKNIDIIIWWSINDKKKLLLRFAKEQYTVLFTMITKTYLIIMIILLAGTWHQICDIYARPVQ